MSTQPPKGLPASAFTCCPLSSTGEVALFKPKSDLPSLRTLHGSHLTQRSPSPKLSWPLQYLPDLLALLHAAAATLAALMVSTSPAFAASGVCTSWVFCLEHSSLQHSLAQMLHVMETVPDSKTLHIQVRLALTGAPGPSLSCPLSS